MTTPTPETAAARFVRDWASMLDDRKDRGLDHQALERVQREYVAPDGSTPADDNNIHH